MKEQLGDRELQPNLFPAVIFVLSSGLHSSELSINKVKLSWAARMRLVATADLASRLNETGHSPLVVVTGGNVYQGQPKLSSIGKSKLVDSYRLPKDQVKAGYGLNTIEEFESIKELIKEQNLSPHNVVVISSGFHLTAKTLSEKLGVNFFSAEEILLQRNRHYKSIVKDIVDSEHYRDLLELQKKQSEFARIPLGRTFYKIADRWLKRNVELTPFDCNSLRDLFETKEG